MAIGKKSGGKNWVKGQSGNPNGRPKLPDEIKEARKISVEKIIEMFSKYLLMTESDFRKVDRNNLTMLETWFLKNIDYAIQKRDHHTFDKILDRVIGRSFLGIKIELPLAGAVTPEQRLSEILKTLQSPEKTQDIKNLIEVKASE
jgi:hypothetical protein